MMLSKAVKAYLNLLVDVGDLSGGSSLPEGIDISPPSPDSVRNFASEAGIESNTLDAVLKAISDFRKNHTSEALQFVDTMLSSLSLLMGFAGSIIGSIGFSSVMSTTLAGFSMFFELFAFFSFPTEKWSMVFSTVGIAMVPLAVIFEVGSYLNGNSNLASSTLVASDGVMGIITYAYCYCR